jgi:hypothetical protein
MAGRVLTKDLDARLIAVEERIEELVGRVSLLDEQARQFGHAQWIAEQAAAQAVQAAQVVQVAQVAQASNGNGAGHEEEESDGRIQKLAAMVSKLDERVEKIASTLVASRWSS